ncbi:MAG: DNA polymerase III subunit beta [Candidatus Margulisbacteria bacterium]|nr:DNA polymerase III subunit beta [Candidatus Margulisiibacteriota bacterium]
MKFTCKRDILQKSIETVGKAISTRTALPIMDNIFLELQENTLTLRGNDLEMGIETSIPVEKVDSLGRILVKSKTITNIISKLSCEMVNICVNENNQLFISSESVDFDILGTSTEEYPVFPSIESGSDISLSVGDLKSLIKYTIFSVSFDETKQFLNGILIKSEGDSLFFVATDGFRLALKKAPIPNQEVDFAAIVPFKAMNELYRIIQNEPSDTIVQITLSDNQVSFRMAHFCLITRIIQGQFPDYKQVMPKESQFKFTVQRRVMLDASERAAIISNESNNVVKYQFKDKTLTIQANAPNLGEFKEEIKVKEEGNSDQVRIAFNVRLVMDVLKTIEADDVCMTFNSELSPCVLTQVNSDAFTYILMPIRTSDYTASDNKDSVDVAPQEQTETVAAASPPPVVEPPVVEPIVAPPVIEPIQPPVTEPVPEPVEPPESEPFQLPNNNASTPSLV